MMPAMKALDVPLTESIANRPDSAIIMGRWEILTKRRSDLRRQLKGKKPFSFDEIADICVATRALWLSVHSLAQAFRRGIDEKLVQELTAELNEALKSTQSVVPDTLPPDGDDIKAKVMSLVRLSIQARIDSLELLLDSCSLDEFEAVGILRHEEEQTIQKLN